MGVEIDSLTPEQKAYLRRLSAKARSDSINYRRSETETSGRMGGLAWLGYLSHTQVVESSNLSPSTRFYMQFH